MDSQTKDSRVCVIGAGPSGMSVLYYFAKLGINAPEVVCYEKGSSWGGQWNYTWRTGTDEYGERVTSGIYRDMWVNLPKEVMELSHYTFDQRYGKTIPSYFPASVFYDYLEGYWKSSEADLSKLIQFTTSVTSVQYSDETDQFTVVTRDLKTRKTNPPEIFSHVIVASGLFTVPNVPEFKGFDTFPGRIMHSQQFKGGMEFRGKRILLIGSSYSAEDAALQCYKYGVGHVIISYRNKPLGYKFPPEIEERPVLVEVAGSVVKFSDGSSAEVDVIIMCTGYKYGFHYLEDSLKISEPLPSFYVDNLYKGIVWLKGGNQKLLYAGALWLVTSLPMVDAQAAWIVKYVTGINPLKPEEEKNGHSLQASPEVIQKYLERINKDLPKIVDIPTEVLGRKVYIRDILADTGYKMDVEAMAKNMNKSFADRVDHLLEFRNFQFTSAYTGHTADAPTTKWLDYHHDDKIPFSLD